MLDTRPCVPGLEWARDASSASGYSGYSGYSGSSGLPLALAARFRFRALCPRLVPARCACALRLRLEPALNCSGNDRWVISCCFVERPTECAEQSDPSEWRVVFERACCAARTIYKKRIKTNNIYNIYIQ